MRGILAGDGQQGAERSSGVVRKWTQPAVADGCQGVTRQANGKAAMCPATSLPFGFAVAGSADCCARPYRIFPGFIRPSGSSACLMERISAISTGDL